MTSLSGTLNYESRNDLHPSQTFEAHQGGVNDLIELQPGKLVSCGADGRVKVWDLAAQANESTFERGNRSIHTVARVAENVFASSTYSRVCLWDVRQESPVSEHPFLCVPFLSGFHNQSKFVVDLVSHIELFDASYSKCMSKIDKQCLRDTTALKYLDGDTIAVGYRNGIFELHNMTTHECVISLQNDDKRVVDFENRENGRLMTATIYAISFWDTVNGHHIDTLKVPSLVETVTKINGSKFLVGDLSGTIIVGDATCLRWDSCFTAHRLSVKKIIELSSGQIATCSLDETIKIWDLQLLQLTAS